MLNLPEMTEWEAECLTLLEAMYATKPLTRGEELLYRRVLLQMGQQTAEQAVAWAIDTWREKFPPRPTPAHLRLIAARLLSPYPSADDAYAEMLTKVRTGGLHSTPHPERPRLFLSGPPLFSHPLVAQAVQHCGGWEMICTGEANYAEGLAKQFKAAYARNAEQFVNEVADALSLPPQQRPSRLFPYWTPFALPTGWREEPESAALPAPPKGLRIEPQELSASMPPEVAEQFRALRGQLKQMPERRRGHEEGSGHRETAGGRGRVGGT